MSLYRAGGFHPVCLGDTLNQNRYEVRHKLGWGGFSTVWLARDRKLEKWVSVKIMIADCLEQSRDLLILQLLRQKQVSKYIIELLDSFTHQGPNGNHQCLVFELLGPTIDHVVADYGISEDRLEPELILKVTRQLLHAAASIHKAGCAHGDISGANIAFTYDLTRSSETEVLRILGAPECEVLARHDGRPLGPGLPRQLVKAAVWEDWTEEDEENIRLIDFGEAFACGNAPSRLAQPGGLEAPETVFTATFDYRVDLWRVGCTIYTLLFASRPFQSLGPIDYVVMQMINFVEELPKEWEQKWRDIKERTGRKYVNLQSDDTRRSKLEQKFHNQVHDPNLKALLPVIKGLMKFLPSDRMEASEALQLLDSLAYLEPEASKHEEN